MSDENRENVHYIMEMDHRISELEKNQKEGWENIKKLFYSLLGDTEKSLKKEIAELREAQKEHVILNGQSINELKERVNNIIITLSENRIITQVHFNTEVLRELLTHIPYKTFDFEDEKQYYNEDYNSKNFITNLLEKLEVGKTKNKECKFCGRKLILYNQKWICGHGCTKPAIKASGGENYVENSEVDSSNRATSKSLRDTNSKPPEPLIGCSYCVHNACKEEPCNSCFEYNKFKPEDRLPGGTGVEPREDDKENIMFGVFNKETHVLVKREDLVRWKEIFDLPYAEFTHPDGRFESDYIKEEYNL